MNKDIFPRLRHHFQIKGRLFSVAMCAIAINSCATEPQLEQVIKLEGQPNTECEILSGTKSLGVFTVPSKLTINEKADDIKAICTINETKVTDVVKIPEPTLEEKIVVKGTRSEQVVESTSIRIVVK